MIAPIQRGRKVCRILAVLAITAALPLAQGCGGSSAPPTDLFFRGVLAGHSSSGPISSTFEIVVYSPNLASQRSPGSRGSNPNELDADGYVFLDANTTFKISGGYDTSGGFHHCPSANVPCSTTTSVPGLVGFQTGTDWVFNGTFQGSSIKGTMTGPNGVSGTFAGEDSAHSKTALLCGTYSGAAGGTWNFVIGASGSLTGAFDGDASGSLGGDASGSSVSINWSGTDAFGAAASGTATGNLDTSSDTVSGSWQGTDGSNPVSGTFQSNSMACPGPQGEPTQGKAVMCAGDVAKPDGDFCDPVSGVCCLECCVGSA